jgi:hypothetical protein
MTVSLRRTPRQLPISPRVTVAARYMVRSTFGKRRAIPTRTDDNETPLIHLNPENGLGATRSTQLTSWFTVGMGVFERSTRAPSIIAGTTHDPFSCGRHGVWQSVTVSTVSTSHHGHSTAERTQLTLTALQPW